MSYVIYHTKSDIEGFVGIFVIVDRLTKPLPCLFMIVLLSYYALFYSLNCHIHELFWLIGFYLAFFLQTILCFVRQILRKNFGYQTKNILCSRGSRRPYLDQKRHVGPKKGTYV